MSIKFGSIIFVILAVFIVKLSFDNYSSAQANDQASITRVDFN
ncbi:MAG: hypothetical protein VYA54_08695 [Bdellovibrionota bacterium]|nr:hypothetical protein [Bdellovibrionota bacterium]